MSDRARVLVCFGDSNTHGTIPVVDLDDARRFGPGERWTGLLAARLGAGWRVIEEGLPGRTTVHSDPIEGAHMNGLAAVPIIIGSHSPIDAIVVMLGTNDLKPRFSVGPADIAGSLDLLIRTIRNACDLPGRIQPRIVLVAPPPMLEVGSLREVFAGGAAKSASLGTRLRTLAAHLGTGFVDAGAYIRSSQIDGIHFDADQQAPLAEAIALELDRIMEPG
jgi:lysophospholipase L1-like esterase